MVILFMECCLCVMLWPLWSDKCGKRWVKSIKRDQAREEVHETATRLGIADDDPVLTGIHYYVTAEGMQYCETRDQLVQMRKDGEQRWRDKHFFVIHVKD